MNAFTEKRFGIWWASLESNQAPTDYESAALTKHELEALQETPHPRPSPASWTGEKDALPAYGREKEGRAAYSRKLFSLSERLGWRSLRSALASI